MEISNPVMSKSLDPLRKTTPDLHRFYVTLEDTHQWYAVMRECRAQFGINWRTQPKVRRRLARVIEPPFQVWFDVPDAKWCTWIALKLGVAVTDTPSKPINN